MSLSLAQYFALFGERERLTAFAKDAAELYERHKDTFDRVSAILRADPLKALPPAQLTNTTKKQMLDAVKIELSDAERLDQQREDRGGA